MGQTSSQQPYRKLPGSHKGFILGKYTLWKGDDHLLQVYSRIGIEDYKRFYYKDIQALIIQKTRVGFVLIIASAALFALTALLTIIADGGWSVFSGLMAAVFLVIFLYHACKGATCRTYLLTAVQTERVQSLKRLSTALRVADRLKPIITGVQGTVQPEYLDRQPIRAPETRPQSVPVPSGLPSNQPLKHESGRVHFLLFCMLIVYSLLVALDLMVSNVVVALISSIGVLGVLICALVALIRQRDSDISRSLQGLTWVSLGYVGVNFLVGYIAGMIYSFRHPQPLTNQWEMYRVLAEISPWESPFLLSFSIFALFAALLMGTAGLLWLRQHRHAAAPAGRRPAVGNASPQAPNTGTGR